MNSVKKASKANNTKKKAYPDNALKVYDAVSPDKVNPDAVSPHKVSPDKASIADYSEHNNQAGNMMKALVIQRYGGPEQLQLQRVPRPVSEKGKPLVRVHAAGVNPVDCKIRNGSMRLLVGKSFPRILGSDIAGVIEESEAGSDFRPGDRVFGMLTLAGGGYADYISVTERQLCRIPEGVGMTEAAATPLASLTALQALGKGRKLKAGDRVLVNGAAGGVGSFAVQIAHAYGLEVTGVCRSDNADFVKKLGAHEVIDYRSTDFTKSGKTWDMVLDAVGKRSYKECRRILSSGGTYVGTLPVKGLLFHQAMNPFRSKRASFVMVKPHGSDLSVIANLMKSGKVRAYVQETFPLEEGVKAHQLIETERVRGKLVLTVE